MKPETVKPETVIGTIDLEPLWVNLIPQFIEWIERGTPEQKKIATDELMKLAKLGDYIRQAQKQGKKTIKV